MQADGDVQLIVNRSLRDLSAERQFEVLEEHFRVVALRLAPLTYMAELTAALRAAIRLIATLGLVGSVAFHSNVGILWALGAAVSSTLLLFFPSVARKLLWWWLKWRIAHSAWVG